MKRGRKSEQFYWKWPQLYYHSCTSLYETNQGREDNKRVFDSFDFNTR